jgi:hypothetical protein
MIPLKHSVSNARARLNSTPSSVRSTNYSRPSQIISRLPNPLKEHSRSFRDIQYRVATVGQVNDPQQSQIIVAPWGTVEAFLPELWFALLILADIRVIAI